MRFNQAAIELQRPVAKYNDSAPSTVGNQDYEYQVPQKIRLLGTLSEGSGESSADSARSAAFITISDCVSFERPWETIRDSNASKYEKADMFSQSWPRVNGHGRDHSHLRLKLADAQKRSRSVRGWAHLQLAGSEDDEQQPPTPRMILKQLNDSKKSRGSNRSSSRSRGSLANSRANSNSMKQRVARSSSMEKVRMLTCAVCVFLGAAF